VSVSKEDRTYKEDMKPVKEEIKPVKEEMKPVFGVDDLGPMDCV